MKILCYSVTGQFRSQSTTTSVALAIIRDMTPWLAGWPTSRESDGCVAYGPRRTRARPVCFRAASSGRVGSSSACAGACVGVPPAQRAHLANTGHAPDRSVSMGPRTKKRKKNDVSKLVNPYAKVICLSPMHPRALDAQRTCFPRRRGFSSNNLILASCTFLGIFPNARRKKEKNTGDFGFSIVNVLFICEPAFTWL